jgi:hypothetical protein
MGPGGRRVIDGGVARGGGCGRRGAVERAWEGVVVLSRLCHRIVADGEQGSIDGWGGEARLTIGFAE